MNKIKTLAIFLLLAVAVITAISARLSQSDLAGKILGLESKVDDLESKIADVESDNSILRVRLGDLGSIINNDNDLEIGKSSVKNKIEKLEKNVDSLYYTLSNVEMYLGQHANYIQCLRHKQ